MFQFKRSSCSSCALLRESLKSEQALTQRILDDLEKERKEHREEVKGLVSRIGVSQYHTPYPTHTTNSEPEASDVRVYDVEGLEYAIEEEED